MTSEHPTPGELLDLHFGELRDPKRERTAAHVSGCPRCREELASVEWVDRAVTALPDEEPPADGLARVLEGVGAEQPAPAGRAGWVAPVSTTVAGLAAGMSVICGAGAWLVASQPAAATPLLESARAVSGFGVAALAFFAVGSFVTLALAPALLIEARSRRRALVGR